MAGKIGNITFAVKLALFLIYSNKAQKFCSEMKIATRYYGREDRQSNFCGQAGFSLKKRALSKKLRTQETGALGGLEEKIISGGDYFNDRRTFVSLETSDSADDKRYKWSDRSELAKEESLSLRARTNLSSKPAQH